MKDRKKHDTSFFIAILFLCLLHTIHLGADTPGGREYDIGLYVDEGYKTLSPRNLVLFGNEHWNECDNYPGWMRESPLTQWGYFLAFTIFGANIQSARSVTIVCYFLFLCGFAYSFKNTYSPKLIYHGLLLFGLQNEIFFQSRVALIEFPIILFTYVMLFILKNMDGMTKGAVKFYFVSSVLLTSYFLIKKTAFIYLTPVLVSTTILFFVKKEIFTSFKKWQFYALLTLILASFAVISFQVWSPRIQFSLGHTVKRVLEYSPLDTSPIIVISGLMCVLHALIFQPRIYIYDAYRLSLLSIIILCPLMLAFFPFNPPRYYVPILPAYILISLEWLNLMSGSKFISGSPSKTALFLSLPLLVLILYYIAQLIGLLHLALICILISFIPSRGKFIKDKIRIPIIIMLILFYIYNIHVVGRFLLRPGYESMKIRTEIMKIIPSGSSIAGDWAPFFTLNTKIKSLYMTRNINPPSNIECLKPDFFLFSNNIWSVENLKILRSLNGVQLGEPIYKSRYVGYDIAIFPVHYMND